MKSLFSISISLVIISLVTFSSCVPLRKFEELKAKRDTCDKENSTLKKDNRVLTTANTELESKIAQLGKQISLLQQDTAITGNSLRKLNANYLQINETYNLLLNKNKELLAGNADETRKILVEMQKQQLSLQQQEDRLKLLEDSIDLKKKSLIILSKQLVDSKSELLKKEEELNANRSELEAQKARLLELENILARKDSAVIALKEKVSKALFNFENNGLTVEQRNGKVYVSMDEKLLFQSGSYTVDVKGKEALKNLAKVLEANTEVNILVEGHTDNVPLKSATAPKDNWELSVMRATAVVKILLEGSSIDAQRLSASGRSQYVPVEKLDTPEARSKNRRTEIILTPKLDELLKVLETN